MFSTRRLFQSLPCPRRSDCTNPTLCPFSHAPDAAPHIQLIAAPSDPTPTPPLTVPAKRPFELTASTSSSEPPPQRLKTASTSKPVALPVHSHSSVRPVAPRPSTLSLPDTPSQVRPSSESMRRSHRWPCLSARCAIVALLAFTDQPPQTMLKSLYDHFVVLYGNLLPSNPTLASEHALRQEEQISKNSTKLTYRNVRIHDPVRLPRLIIPLRQSSTQSLP